MSGQTLLLEERIVLPLVPLRDVVMYPKMVIPLFVGRAKSIRALEIAMASAKRVLLLTQKNGATGAASASAGAKPDTGDDIQAEDLFDVGCIGHILQMLKLPDGTVKVLIEGQQRAQVHDIQSLEGDIFGAEVTPLIPLTVKTSKSLEALRRAIIERFEAYTKLSRRIPTEIMASIAGLDDAGRMTDTISSHVPFKLAQKQAILSLLDLPARMKELLRQLETEIDILNVDKKIRNQIKKSVDKNQRDFYLREQAQAIQKELNEGDDSLDASALEKKVKLAKMPKEAEKKALKEVAKLKTMSSMSSEATVVRNYVDVLIGLPWSKKTKIKHDLIWADSVLNEDHFGLDKVKERILEYLAVQQRVGKLKAPILCLVGPPGVGKTSLGQSIAKATGRKYVRMALGGMRDEAEIRGHRRTYIGALPGKLLQSLTKVGTRNPLFLLDEIDKIGSDVRGDPSSALLEVLDPEQNHTFNDHYVELDFDLSDVMFVATSNTLNIPPALLDRMEVIRLSGYTEDEKTNIAIRYLLPKQLKNNGLAPKELVVEEAAIRDMVRYYTREAGVRNLERDLSNICRKVVKGIQLKTYGTSVTVTADNLMTFLGVRKFNYGRAEKQNQVGQVVGLAWTEVGGDLLTIETAVMPGKGNITRTGSLGDVMKESVEAARTVVRSRAKFLGIHDDVFEKKDLHIHVPDGGTPKDGPSAGAAMTTSIVSALTGIPVRADVAMTGEITLRGEVTAIGGLKEKLLAALRGGIKTVIIPEDNIKDLTEIPDNVKNTLEIIPVRWIDRVLEVALERMPQALTEKAFEGILPNLPNPAELLIKGANNAIVMPRSKTKH
ncbi:MAG: endopeptidase La [Cytophagales bacterium]|nr:endopeptidase La [Cytophagales bacterium]